MAGVLDMKGRTRKLFAPSRNTPMFTLMVETQLLSVVRRLSKLTGTRVAYSDKRSLSPAIRRGCVEHCPEPHTHINPVIPEIGRWHISGVGAVIVLDNLMDYFTDDVAAKHREFIDEAMTWIDPTKGRGQHAIKKTIKRLDGLGWQILPELEV
jgi:hypothetical protein